MATGTLGTHQFLVPQPSGGVIPMPTMCHISLTAGHPSQCTNTGPDVKLQTSRQSTHP